MNFYIMENKEVPWGDYGYALCYGYLNMMDEDYNDLDVPELERTGPYIPQFYIANSRDILIIDSLKDIFLSSDIKGIEKYIKTKKKQMVRIEWTEWDFDAEPRFYPESGEPEDYIWEKDHDEEMAKKMPEVFLLEIEEKYELKKINDKSNYNDYNNIVLEEEPSLDIFTPTNMLYVIVSEKFKNIAEQAKLDSVKFIKLQRG